MKYTEVFIKELDNEKYVVLKDSDYKIKVLPNITVEEFCSKFNFLIVKEKKYISSLKIMYYRAYKNGEIKVFDTRMEAEAYSNLVEHFEVCCPIYED